MAIVYRIETSEGFGPYAPVAPDFPEIEEYHPNPLDAGIEGEHGWVFGFSDLEEIPLWFSGSEVGILRGSEHEWLVSKYEVDPRYLSSVPLQAAFDKSQAALIGCFSLSELVGVPRSRFSAARVAELESLFEPREAIPRLRGLSISTENERSRAPSIRPQLKAEVRKDVLSKIAFSVRPFAVIRISEDAVS